MITTESDSDNGRGRKERLYQLFTIMAAALANPHRLELIDLLLQAPRTVEELAAESGMSIANTSQHLQRLKQARLVESVPQGLYRRYRLADPAVARLWLELRTLAGQQLEEVEQALDAYRHRRHEFEPIAVDELQESLREGTVILLDVRPRVEYEAGHLPGAISLPVDEVKEGFDTIPRDKTVVAYCRGPYCVYADQALDILRDAGFQVRRLEEGIAEWEAMGLATS